eukprot:COSAG04_NODE_3936_length_2411_cov_1.932958_3_plen_36_part_01
MAVHRPTHILLMAGFQKLGVPSHRLILGLPWVGMVY